YLPHHPLVVGIGAAGHAGFPTRLCRSAWTIRPGLCLWQIAGNAFAGLYGLDTGLPASRCVQPSLDFVGGGGINRCQRRALLLAEARDDSVFAAALATV